MDFGNENSRREGHSLDWKVTLFLILLVLFLGLLILIYDHGWDIVFQSGIRESLDTLVNR